MVLALVASACGGSKASPEPSRTPDLPGWLGMTDAPAARDGAAAAVADGLLYTAGGMGRDGILRSVAFYDPAVNAWTSGPDLPIALRDAAAVGRGPEVIVLGGFTDAAGKVPSKRVFSLSGPGWKELPSLIAPRGALGAAVVKGKVYAIGGVAPNGRATGRVEILDGAGWTPGASMPTGRSHMGVTAGERYIYALGGRSGTATRDAEKARREVERLDTATGKWQRRTPLNVGRSSPAAVGGDTLVLAIGGSTAKSEGLLSTIESYAIGSNLWEPFEPPLPIPVRSSAAGVIGEKIIVATGVTVGPDPLTPRTWSLSVALTPLLP